MMDSNYISLLSQLLYQISFEKAGSMPAKKTILVHNTIVIRDYLNWHEYWFKFSLPWDNTTSLEVSVENLSKFIALRLKDL